MTRTMRLAVTALMLLTAVVLLGIVFNIMNPPELRKAANVPPPLLTPYLVAARPIPAGTLARDEDFSVRQLSADLVPPGAIGSSPDARASLRGSLVRRFLDAGTPVTADDVLRPRDRGFIASVLQDGTRAVTIGVDAVSGVAGLIWPGDHVDVVLTQDMRDAAVAHRTLAETILSNVRVIAIDQEMVQGAPSDNNPAAGKLAHTVTLQVQPEEVQKVAVAQHLGKLSLSIRAAADQRNVEAGKPTYGADVSPALSDAETPTGRLVIVTEGDRSKEVVFK